MMDIVEPEFDYTAGLYAKQAKECIYNIINNGKTPIIVGGTGLYFRLLLENYIMPEVEPNPELREELKPMDSKDLHTRLSAFDSKGASQIDPNDKKKLIRAIEIVETLNKPLSEVRSVGNNNEFDIEWIGKNFPREILYERINKRVDLMVDAGMIEETQFLLKKHGRIPNIINTIGYQEIVQYLDGIYTLEEALEKLKQNTRRYAKRQLTWFRKNPNIKWDCYPELLKK